MFTWSVLAALTVLAGVGLGAIGAVVWRAHDGPGSAAFVATMAGSSVSALSY